VLNEKIRPHHEAHEGHEGHEGFRIFQTPNFVIFVSFVVNIFLPIWLRRSRAGLSVLSLLDSLCAAAINHALRALFLDAVRFRNPRATSRALRDAIHRTADQQVRDKSENERNDQRLSGIKPAKHKVLVNHIHHHGDDENFRDCLPPFARRRQDI
jgi:hypothetical protein